MALVRFRVARRARVEFHERPGPEVLVGSGERADLRILDPSVADRHAQVLVRRGRPILTDLGRSRVGISKGEERLRAPVAAHPTDVIRLGEIDLTVVVVHESEAGLVGTAIPGGQITEELASFDEGVRRYRTDSRQEIAVLDDVAGEWPQANADCSGHPAVFESLGDGVRIESVLTARAEGLVRLPVEAAVIMVAHLLEATADYHARSGPHGAIEPRRVHLGVDGSIRLVTPGPTINLSDERLDAYLAPERRFGLAPSVSADAYAVACLSLRLLDDPQLAPMRRIFERMLDPTPIHRDADFSSARDEVRLAAQTLGIDPTYLHAARVARVLFGALARPLVATSTPFV